MMASSYWQIHLDFWKSCRCIEDTDGPSGKHLIGTRRLVGSWDCTSIGWVRQSWKMQCVINYLLSIVVQCNYLIVHLRYQGSCKTCSSPLSYPHPSLPVLLVRTWTMCRLILSSESLYSRTSLVGTLRLCTIKTGYGPRNMPLPSSSFWLWRHIV